MIFFFRPGGTGLETVAQARLLTDSLQLHLTTSSFGNCLRRAPEVDDG